MRDAIRIVPVLLALLVLGACTTPTEPEMRWVRDGATEEDLARDQQDCLDEAVAARAQSKRWDHVARGSAFMTCMTSRGWRQEAVEPGGESDS